jgi:hypothetical protein
MKERALARLQEPEAQIQRYRAPDSSSGRATPSLRSVVVPVYRSGRWQ